MDYACFELEYEMECEDPRRTKCTLMPLQGIVALVCHNPVNGE